MEYYSAMKRNKLLIHITHTTVLCKIKKPDTRLYIIRFHLYERSRKGKSIET